MRRFLNSAESVVLAYVVAVTVIVVVGRPSRFGIYLAYHGAVVVLLGILAYAERRYGGNLWKFLRHWMPLFLVLASFREMHYLIPEIHPFDDHASDLALMELDRLLFGDVYGTMRRIWWAPFVEFLHVCYWSYFSLPVLLGVVLYRQGRMDVFRRVATILLVGFGVSYLLYATVPAVGPHHFEVRSPALDGLWLGGRLHRFLLTIEWRMPDAFPSLHTATAALVVVLAWRFERRVFWIVVVPAIGLILATFILRYHYVVDVVAGLALVPVALAVGDAIFRIFERAEA